MIEITDGVGIEFIFQDKKCITLPRSGMTAKVTANISTYGTITPFASHFYAYLDVMSCQCKEIDTDKLFISNNKPKASSGKRVTVYHNSPVTTYAYHQDRKIVDLKKGAKTRRFDTIIECIESIESTFTSLFDSEWTLVGSNYEPWEEYKNEMTEVYG